MQAKAGELFLEGPRSRELLTLVRVMRDFLRGFRGLHFVGPCVTVFGSARIKNDSRNYDPARKMGAAIAQLGFTVHATDSVDDAIVYIRKKVIGPFGLRMVHRLRPQRFWLREHGLKCAEVQITS